MKTLRRRDFFEENIMVRFWQSKTYPNFFRRKYHVHFSFRIGQTTSKTQHTFRRNYYPSTGKTDTNVTHKEPNARETEKDQRKQKLQKDEMFAIIKQDCLARSMLASIGFRMSLIFPDVNKTLLR